MIAPHDLGMDLGGGHPAAQRRGHQEVVDPPPDVARPRVREMAPPGVVSVALLEQPEGIDESRVDEVLKSLALLVREALLAAVGLGIARGRARCERRSGRRRRPRAFRLELPAVREKRRVPVLVPQRKRLRSSLAFGV